MAEEAAVVYVRKVVVFREIELFIFICPEAGRNDSRIPTYTGSFQTIRFVGAVVDRTVIIVDGIARV